MKTLLFAILMAVSVSAQSYSKGDIMLVLTIEGSDHSSMTMGWFGRMEACEKAGKKWLASHDENRFSGTRAHYTCSRTY